MRICDATAPIRILLTAIVTISGTLGTVACTASSPGTSVATPYPAGLWDAHVHLTRWGEDALDSLTKYGVVGVRGAGADPVLLVCVLMKSTPSAASESTARSPSPAVLTMMRFVEPSRGPLICGPAK